MVGGVRWMVVIFSVIVVMVRMVACNIVLIGENVSKSFDDVEATFTPTIKRTGENGVLYVAEPLDACSSLKSVAGASQSPFALIVRGVCTFDVKVKNAQDAGFKAAIVYDNEESSSLVAMAGDPVGIHIPAVFVSKSSGEELKQYEGSTDMELWIIPKYENATWSIMAISFISLLALSAVLATCFFVRRHRITRQRPLVQNVREFHGMSRRLVKAMPTLIFTSVLEDNCTSQTCAICLEDYSVGDKLRLLPCCHKFHALCVDSWLTAWRTFCPVCKRDARTSTGEPPASESTPLLSAAASTPFSSFHSSLRSSNAIQILPTIPRSTSNSQRSYNNSPSINISRRSAGHPSSTPLNSQYISNHITSSINASPGYLVGSSSRYSYLRNCGMSGSPIYAIGSSSRYSYLRDCTEPGSLSYGGSSYLGSSSRLHNLRTYDDSSSPNHIVGSSSRNSYLRHCNESRESISALSSAQSLPGC